MLSSKMEKSQLSTTRLRALLDVVYRHSDLALLAISMNPKVGGWRSAFKRGTLEHGR